MKKHKTVRQDKTMDKSFFEELKLLMPTAMVSDFRNIIY